MAIADYFVKNVQAASLLLHGFDSTAFRSLLEKQVIGVAFDKSATNTPEGLAALDLVIRLLARLYPNITLAALDNVAKEKSKIFEALAKEINPKITTSRIANSATHWLVVGKSRLKLTGPKKVSTFYIGSDNWITKLSTSSPVGSGRSLNPFGAGAAACFGAANIFRAIFSAQLPGSQLDSEISMSVLDLKPKAPRPKNPLLNEVDFGEFHLVGVGAVGNGFLWALSRLKCKGELHLVDGETLELSNMQRYAMTSPPDNGKFKSDLGKTWLSGGKLSVKSHKVTWEDYIAERNNWRIERVAVAVDSAATRINIQAALPKYIFNSWTQAGEIGLSRHTFLGNAACLACLYIPKSKTLNLDDIVLKALRLPEDGPNLMDVRTRLDTGQPTERAFLERIATANNISIKRLLLFEGKPLHNFYVEAVCSGAVLEFNSVSQSNRTDVPMVFQSALAGILLAADVIADIAQLRPMLPTISQIDLLRALPSTISTPQRKRADSRCICSDLDFVHQYKLKYQAPSGTRRKTN